LVILVAVLSAACGPLLSPASTPSAASVSSRATVAVATSAKLGKHLVDGKQMTLYIFDRDPSSTPTCYDACAKFWPPLLTTGAPIAGPGVNPTFLGTTTRKDGTHQVTYAAHPLYYVVTDHNPGDVTGQEVDNFGAPWFVIGPDGNKIGGHA